jgi:thiosulfate dehydrogenase
MRNKSIQLAVGGALCLLLSGFLVGCSERGAAPNSAPPAADKSSTTSALADAAVAPGGETQTDPAPAKKVAEGKEETQKVGACDGGKPVEVPKGLAGQPLADNLMDQWKRNHPESKWVAEEKERHTLQPPADNSDLLQGGQAKGDTYGNFTQRDLAIWTRETEKFAAEGSRIFHNADELGSTVAVSCDMCHPHAANTHPETYPKFQVQLGRVVLLRDMINWCVENPVRGPKLDPDGPKMRALEAYIQAQRKGVPMNYGKH